MRRLWVCLAAVGCLTWSGTAAASTAPNAGAGATSTSFPSGCDTTAYTADGGYFSQAQFFWEPGDDVTLTTNWCFSAGKITSYSVTYTTTIQSPRILINDYLIKSGQVLKVQLDGSYNTGVINNVGHVGIVGDVSRRGHSHFANDSMNGG
jgi:hypothetical protein